jgi:putative ABC transport system substrate-binding protein
MSRFDRLAVGIVAPVQRRRFGLSRFDRGSVLLALGVALWAAPSLGAEPQVRRVGFLAPTAFPAREAVFREELKRLGFAENGNLRIEYRSARGDFARLPALAEELVALKVDVIAAVVTQASLAARKATATIPIVMIGVGDPVGSGLVANLAHPGGNVTGASTLATDVVGKQLQLLQDMVPGARRVAALSNPANRVFQQQQVAEARESATKLQLQLALFEARTPDEIDRAFAALSKERPDALLILADPVLATHSKRIADLALRHRIPGLGGSAFAASGLLAGYGPDFLEGYRRAAWYVSRILNGAKPGDLPVEQSTKFELIVNAGTARALGVAIPPSIVARADQIIQ